MSQEFIENIVEIDNGKMFTTSLIVAQAFDKEHKNVLRDIETLDCSPEFRQLNFEHTPYVHPQNRETYPAYRLTRDGFAFLAMGFTGKKAAAWKEKFLMAFNAMEEALTACGTLSSVRQPLSLKASIKSLNQTGSIPCCEGTYNALGTGGRITGGRAGTENVRCTFPFSF